MVFFSRLSLRSSLEWIKKLFCEGNKEESDSTDFITPRSDGPKQLIIKNGELANKVKLKYRDFLDSKFNALMKTT